MRHVAWSSIYLIDSIPYYYQLQKQGHILWGFTDLQYPTQIWYTIVTYPNKYILGFGSFWCGLSPDISSQIHSACFLAIQRKPISMVEPFHWQTLRGEDQPP